MHQIKFLRSLYSEESSSPNATFDTDEGRNAFVLLAIQKHYGQVRVKLRAGEQETKTHHATITYIRVKTYALGIGGSGGLKSSEKKKKK